MQNDKRKELLDIFFTLGAEFREMCMIPIRDERFLTGYGGRAHHHAYIGGLLDHTYEVVKACYGMSGYEVNRNVLITAAVWHDFCKIYEYKWNEEAQKIEDTEYKDTTGHVVGSALTFLQEAHYSEISTLDMNAITHCMLAHHGRKEWGSPAEPRTKEAWILHSADMLSSRGLL